MDMMVETKVHDLGLAATLLTMGYSNYTIVYDKNRRAQFVFSTRTPLDVEVEDYWANCITVNAREYFDNTKLLKNRIYSDR